MIDETKSHYPINYVSKQSGLTTHTIRIWERRYAAVVPERTESGHRIYSDDDINRLRLLHKASEAGHTISKLAKLSNDKLRSILRDTYDTSALRDAETEYFPKTSAATKVYLDTAKKAVVDMNKVELENLLMKSSVELSNDELMDELLTPLLIWVGDSWHDGLLRIANEHLASTTIRSFLERVRRTIEKPQDAKVITVTTLVGQKHELGALLVCIEAAKAGWQEYYFGSDMPAVEIAKAAADTGSAAVAVSAPLTGKEADLLQELVDLREYLPPETAVIAGGAGIEIIKDNLTKLNIRFCSNLKDLRAHLNDIS